MVERQREKERGRERERERGREGEREREKEMRKGERERGRGRKKERERERQRETETKGEGRSILGDNAFKVAAGKLSTARHQAKEMRHLPWMSVLTCILGSTAHTLPLPSASMEAPTRLELASALVISCSPRRVIGSLRHQGINEVVLPSRGRCISLYLDHGPRMVGREGRGLRKRAVGVLRTWSRLVLMRRGWREKEGEKGRWREGGREGGRDVTGPRGEGEGGNAHRLLLLHPEGEAGAGD